MIEKEYALVTGASRGIGRQIAIELADAGHNLIITCEKSKNELQILKEELITKGVECLSYCGLIENIEFQDEIFRDIQKNNIFVSILINNAAISSISLLQDMRDDLIERIINVNLKAPILLTKRVVKGMITNKKGKIINISSVWGIYGASCESVYSATKAGLNIFSKSMAKELGPSNIQVNCIACGLVDTDMNKDIDKQDLDSIVNDIPANRIAKTKDIAKMVLSILETSDYLTGQTIQIDGGWM